MRTSNLTRRYRFFLIPPLILLFTLFFIGGPDYQSPRSYQAAWNLGHIIFFSIVPLMVFLIPSMGKVKPAVLVAGVIGITFVAGMMVEVFQYGLDRTPDIGDLLRNMIGALIALLFFLPTKKELSRPALLVLRVFTIALVVTQFFPIFIALIDEHQARRDFPVLSDFQTPFQIYRWSGDADIGVVQIPDHPEQSALRVRLTTRKYSGVSLKYFSGKWQGFQRVQLRVYNPSAQQLKLTCRIHDAEHTEGIQKYQDRYNRSHFIQKGWNTITVNLEEVRQAPANRSMDLDAIRGIGIFATRLSMPRTVYIDDLVLAQ